MFITKLHIFVLFIIFSKTFATEKKRFKCPSFTNLDPEEIKTEPLSSKGDENFYCENYLFYEENSCECVPIEKCPEVYNLLHLEIEAIINAEKFIMGLDFSSLLEGDIWEFFKLTVMKLGIITERDFENYEDEKDVDLIENVIEENVGAVLYNYSRYLVLLTNKSIIRSIKKKCGDNQLCMTEYLLKKNEKNIKKIVEDFMPEFISGLRNLDADLKTRIAEQCKEDECVFARTFLVTYNIIIDQIETYIKPIIENLSQNIRKLLSP
ncbi:uncharacterized protein LOC130452917 [Diorhabda sublineata]|uniref:uncharacterized protein LOC130452917 n=1 Tax=Diorhabda sublineata TaxID=1163346 RepID=UPI0024E10D02|nr:uncharacterized protein LOC130452917 [Diorhabda sublineata]